MGTANARFLLGLLIGVLLGGALAHFMGSSSVPNEVQALALTPEHRAKPIHNPVAPARELASASLERTEARALPAAMRASELSSAELGSLMSGLERDAVRSPTGNGSISGEVLDENGVGLPDVLVRMTRSSSSGSARTSRRVGEEAPELETLEDAVKRTAESYHERRAYSQDTRTDASGAYRFDGLPDERWSLAAYRTDYSITAQGAASALRVGSELNFSAVPVSAIATRVFAASGELVAEALLQVKESGQRYGSKLYKWTTEEPDLYLVPGQYELTAFADGTGSVEDYRLSSVMQEVAVAAGGPAEALSFELRARLGVRGMLREAKDNPPSDRYYVHLLALAPEQEVDLKLLANSEARGSTQSGGEYTFLELEPGRYAVGVSRSYNSSILHHMVVDVTDRIVQADLNIPPMDRSRFLRVIAQDSHGEALKGVSLEIANLNPKGFRYSRSETVTDRDGSYLVAVHDDDAELYWGKAAGGSFELRATHKEYGTRTTPLSSGQSEALVNFTEPGRLVATVAGYQGSGYEGRLTVRVVRADEDPSRRFMSSRTSDKVGPDGTQTIESLEPGAYRVELEATSKEAPQNFFNSSNLDSVELEIFAGENTVQLTIPTLYPLRVHWAEGKPGTDMYLSNAQEGSMFGNMTGAKLDASGFANWEELKAGDYLVRAGSGQMQVSVPCGEVEFEAMKTNALRVTISDKNGDLAKAGLKSGDLIIGSDGKEFGDTLNYSFLGKLTNERAAQAVLIVMRGRSRLEFTLRSEDVDGWKSLGAQLVPATR